MNELTKAALDYYMTIVIKEVLKKAIDNNEKNPDIVLTNMKLQILADIGKAFDEKMAQLIEIVNRETSN